MPINRRSVLEGIAPFAVTALADGAAPIDTREGQPVERWQTFGASFPGPTGGNPFLDVQFSAEFRQGNRSVVTDGFYDGAGIYRVRFMPDTVGEWSFITRSNAPQLDKKRGTFTCIRPSPQNHGPVVVGDLGRLLYADGTAHVSFGTTCYTWVHQKEDLETQTLRTLQSSPFNKIRMCILPTESDPARYPFLRDAAGRNDLSRFDVTFFQHIDERIQDLMRLGIQADLILFHPYDHLGYGDMPAVVNERYLRYVVARFAAYQNVWWSVANEFDLVKAKRQPDWDNYFRIISENDPYRHLLSIHYSRVFYDYSKPWVTHLSLQTDDFDKTAMWLSEYRKPILFDECKYEGNINKRWGNLHGREMVRRFWLGMVMGAYVGHGETFHDDNGAAWTSKGGVLLGESPKRIQFLRDLFAKAPADALVPDPEDYYHSISKPDEYYLFYFDYHQPAEYEFPLSDRAKFKGEVIDPWKMTVSPLHGTFTGKSVIKLPGKPYLAVRFTKV
jgi:Domain of unknown function (DUF5060)/Domain of unknown function (DUF5605)/Protein of unknown function (DUF4038)